MSVILPKRVKRICWLVPKSNSLSEYAKFVTEYSNRTVMIPTLRSFALSSRMMANRSLCKKKVIHNQIYIERTSIVCASIQKTSENNVNVTDAKVLIK